MNNLYTDKEIREAIVTILTTSEGDYTGQYERALQEYADKIQHDLDIEIKHRIENGAILEVKLKNGNYIGLHAVIDKLEAIDRIRSMGLCFKFLNIYCLETKCIYQIGCQGARESEYHLQEKIDFSNYIFN